MKKEYIAWVTFTLSAFHKKKKHTNLQASTYWASVGIMDTINLCKTYS